MIFIVWGNKNVRETQASIVEWADDTFGPSKSVFRLVGRANTEMAELVRAATSGDDPLKIAEEAADVAIVLCRAADMLGRAAIFEGPSTNPLRITMAAVHANRAMADLLAEMERDRPWTEHAGTLIDRVFLFLRRVCEAAGTTLAEQVDRKQTINRARRWVLAGDGTGSHVGGDEHHIRIEDAD